MVALLILILSLRPAALAATSDPLIQALREVQQLIQQGKWAIAQDKLERSLKEFPNDSNLYNFMGVVEAQKGNAEAAEASFRKAIALSPRAASTYLNLGAFYQGRVERDPQALEKASKAYQTLLQFLPGNVEANFQSAKVLQRLGNFQESLDRVSALPADIQGRPQVQVLRCVNQAGLGQEQQAKNIADRLLASPDLTESDLLSMLPASNVKKFLPLRQRLLEGLQARSLASWNTLRQLGLVYEEQGQLDQARRVLEGAAQKDPDLASLLLELARVAHKQKDFQGALGYLAHARDLEPDNAGIHFFFGMVCVDAELPLDARQSLERAVKLDPDNAYYNYALAAVLLQDKDPSLSIPYFQKYRELKPGDIRGRFSLGTAYFYNSAFPQAKAELGVAAGDPVTAAGAHYFLARIAKQENDLAAAEQHLQASLRINPDHAEARAELALVYVRNKEYAKAEQELSRALKLDPESYLANLNLLNLYQRTKDRRAEEQAARFEIIKKKRSERQQALLRTIEIRPY